MRGNRMAMAISLWQPWATLVVIGAKKFETRSWATPYRGKLVIHAAKRFTAEERQLCRREPFCSVLTSYGYLVTRPLPFGVALGVVDLVDILPTNTRGLEISEQERAFGNYAPGRFAWRLENYQQFAEPIVLRGQQGLWQVSILDGVIK